MTIEELRVKINNKEKELIQEKEMLAKLEALNNKVAADGLLLSGDSTDKFYGYQSSLYFETKEKCYDEAIRFTILKYIRTRACELNSNSDWRRFPDKFPIETTPNYFICIEKDNIKAFRCEFGCSLPLGVSAFDNLENIHKVIAEIEEKFNKEIILNIFSAK